MVGTIAWKLVLFVGAVKVAGVPLKVTLVVPSKFCPVMVMVVPGGLLVGEKLTIRGRRKKIAEFV